MSEIDDDLTPAWATGPDCFESPDHHKQVERDRWHERDGTIDAYDLGGLHELANAIEVFQSRHRMVFREELEDLHTKLVQVIGFFDRGICAPEFPLQRRPGQDGYTA